MEKGLYLYVGSAKKGLEQRLARHMKKRKNRFWHIDYITSRRDSAVQAIYLSPSPECETLSTVSQLGRLFGRKLGSSDCKCPSHFVKLNQVDIGGLRNRLTLEGFVEFPAPMPHDSDSEASRAPRDRALSEHPVRIGTLPASSFSFLFYLFPCASSLVPLYSSP